MTAKMRKHEIDESGTEKVAALIEQVKAAGLSDAATMFETVYWGWLRFTQAYVFGLPYVEKPEAGGMTPYSALHVTSETLGYWAPKIPGTPQIDNEAVRWDAECDEEWHRQEDRRMRREAGECL